MQSMQQTREPAIEGALRPRMGALTVLVIGFVFVVIGAWYTDVHRPLPNPLQPVAGARWWFTPLERNAFMRMPVVDGRFRGLDVFDDGRVIWAVGDQGLLIGTRDGGRSWLRGTIISDAVPTEPTASKPRPLGAFNFIPSAHAGESPVTQTPVQSPVYGKDDEPTNVAQSKLPNAPTRVIKTPAQSAPFEQSTPTEQPTPPEQSTAPAQPTAPVQPRTRDITRATLYDVKVLDATRAVAVGEGGLILFTSDGGETWRPTLPPREDAFVGVSFLPNRSGALSLNGAAISDGGRVVITRDGGEHWSEMGSGYGDMRAIASMGLDSWWIVGRGGRTWVARLNRDLAIQAFAAPAALQAITSNGDIVLAVGPAGTVLRTTPDERQWSRAPFASSDGSVPDLTAVTFGANDEWIVASATGWIYSSADQGQSWNVLRRGAGKESIAAMLPNRALYAVGAGGLFQRASTLGGQWEPLTISQGVFASLRMTDSSRGVISGANGLRLETGDGGSTWRVSARADDTTAQATSIDSMIAAAANIPGAPPAPRAQAFFDQRLGLRIDENGALARTENGGGTWKPAIVSTGVPLLDVKFASRNRAVLLALGRVLVSSDAGATFAPVSYRRYPSPWIWLAAALLLVGAIYSLRRQLRSPAVAQQSTSIADAAASDRPIDWSDPDPAGLRDIALGLSRFMRNRRTEPPLTIAITGEWGTGKSSLMNLLRHDLHRYGYRPVWFNAWHHQSGENLLGSLLANIHAQGVPPWHTLAGIDFRTTLLLIRARRFWMRLAFTLFLLAVIFFSYRTLGTSADKLWESLTSASSSGFKDLGAATGLLGLLVALLTPVFGAVRAVSAFGLQPGKLIAAVASTRADESARQQAGARYRFAREFEDFTRALDPRPLVIFIDDLDRCRAENVIEVLEAVNFLVSSGRCMVVVGMARRWVETCVGLAFKDLAMAQAEGPVAQGGADALTEQQLFARNYLEKLINVEIRVPRLSDSAARALLQGEEPAAREDAKRAVVRVVFSLAPQVVLAMIACAIVGLGWLTAEWLKDLDAQAQRREQITTATNAPSKAALPPTVSTRKDVQEDAPVAFENAQARSPWSWYFGTGGTLLVALSGLGILALFARKEARTDDSPDFRDALAILQPWIALGGSSPRSLKRFVNHVRYIAMRFRTGAEIPNVIERCAQRVARTLGLGSSATASSDAMPRVQLPEELLVAFATLHRCNEQWLEQLFLTRTAQLPELAERLLAERFPQADERATLLERLLECFRHLNTRFPDSALGSNELMDRRYAIAFYEAMAIDAGVRNQAVPDEPIATAEPLRPAAS